MKMDFFEENTDLKSVLRQLKATSDLQMFNVEAINSRVSKLLKTLVKKTEVDRESFFEILLSSSADPEATIHAFFLATFARQEIAFELEKLRDKVKEHGIMVSDCFNCFRSRMVGDDYEK